MKRDMVLRNRYDYHQDGSRTLTNAELSYQRHGIYIDCVEHYSLGCCFDHDLEYIILWTEGEDTDACTIHPFGV